MENIYNFAISQLKGYGRGLSKKSVLIDKPWAFIDENNDIQKLIFRKNEELIISKNGQVRKGRWEYLAQAQSILIDRGNDTILCKEGFMDEGVLILKKDGTENQFFTLANENKVPDLDAVGYLNNLLTIKLGLKIYNVQGGEKLEIKPSLRDSIVIGDKVSRNFAEIEDGTYQLERSIRKLAVRNSTVVAITYERKYKILSGPWMTVEQKNYGGLMRGDRVFINGLPAEDGKYRLDDAPNIAIKDGVISSKSWIFWLL